LTLSQESICIGFDFSQITKIRWNMRALRYEGMTYDYGNEAVYKPKFVQLENTWVHQNYPEDFLTKIRAEAEQTKCYIHVRVGAPRTSTKIPKRFIVPLAPIISFRQKETYWTCISDSLASALSFLGLAEAGRQLSSFGRKLQGSGGTKVSWIARVNEKLSQILPKLEPFKMKRRIWTIEKLLHPTKELKMIVLLGSDGDTSHAVTIYDEWIFDSAFSNAFPLCLDALNFLCGDDCYLVGLSTGYIYRKKISQFHKRRKRRSRASSKAQNKKQKTI
jgi:hypothetical protein